MNNDRDALIARIAVLEAALRPFAAIVPSCLYSDADDEEYCIWLREASDKRAQFRRSDILRAKEAMK